MTRIVSGFQTQGGDWDGGAILRGFRSGQGARLDEEQSQRANAQLAFQIQKALADQLAEEEAAQQKQAAARQQGVEMDKAGRLQQMAQRAEAGQVNPGQKFVERVIGARGRLKDPKALAMFDDSVTSILKSQKAAKSRKAAEEAIGMAEQDQQDFTPEEVQLLRQELDAGGEGDIIVRKIQEKRMKNAAESLAVEENDQLLAQAQQLVDAASEGFGKEQAKIALRVAMRSDSLKKRKGSGAVALKQVEEALLGPRSEYGKVQMDPFSDPKERGAAIDDLEAQEIPVTEQAIRARIGVKYGQRPKPTPQEEQIGKTRREHTEVPATVSDDIPNVIGSALNAGADSHEALLDKMIEAGIPLTAENIEAAKQQIQSWRDMRATAGAERARR